MESCNNRNCGQSLFKWCQQDHFDLLLPVNNLIISYRISLEAHFHDYNLYIVTYSCVFFLN